MLEEWRPGRWSWSLVRGKTKWVGARSYRALVVNVVWIAFETQWEAIEGF